jgi:hypothetical protein
MHSQKKRDGDDCGDRRTNAECPGALIWVVVDPRETGYEHGSEDHENASDFQEFTHRFGFV